MARRGILNAAFTIKEMRELFKIKSIKCDLNLKENFEDLDLEHILKNLSRPRKRLTEFMFKLASEERTQAQEKTLKFSFLKTPLEILGK